ncbi:membrane metallo-endopeptidase-like 1 isoform X2 [Orussus abietinus]|uniref:membrane metallo-endopeptidase-like 1 isoform X2 n=1 Tax=Orussus abietinus TaxID=222816 RepID=UPI000625E53B|nr:membrane metallo-endopeptidase-like 1 isoform X2 [Orussus abietinus]
MEFSNQICMLKSRNVILYLTIVFLTILQEVKTQTPKPIPSTSETSEICSTEVCRNVASNILKNMDTSADPCYDFYQFSCGHWINYHTIPLNKGYHSEIDVLTKKNEDRKKAILEETINSNDIESVQKAKKWHQVCLNIDDDREGIVVLANIIRKFGGWPMAMMANQWNPNGPSWQIIDNYYTQLTGRSTFFHFTIVPNPLDKNVTILSVGRPQLTFPLRILMNLVNENNHTGMLQYMTTIVTLFKHVGLNSSEITDYDAIMMDAKALIRLELSLLDAGLVGPQNRREIQISSSTIFGLQNFYNQRVTLSEQSTINWLDVVNNLLRTSNMQVTEREKILISPLEYFAKLGAILNNTPKRTLINYVHWRFIYKTFKYSNENMRQLDYGIKKELLQTSSLKPRWKDCIRKNPFKEAIIYQYLTKFVSDDSIEKVRTIFTEIKGSVETQISNTRWLNTAEKNAAIKKLRFIKGFIAHLGRGKDSVYINKLYERLPVTSTYMVNVLNYKTTLTMQRVTELTKPVEKYTLESVFMGDPLAVNAFYRHTLNMISILAGVFDWPYFLPDMPESMQYGAIGSAIGHEISHAFDTKGIRFNYLGKEEQTWSPEAVRVFNSKAQCFIDQFNGYQHIELANIGQEAYANGNSTCSENMADTAGLQAAFAAFQKLPKNRGKGYKSLIGLQQFSSEQLFFLSFASVRCAYITPQYLAYLIQFPEVHSRPRLRVRGAVSNMEEFSKAFKCRKGSRLNPETKCVLWS